MDATELPDLSTVQRIGLGHSNAYLVGTGDSYVLVDAGAPGKAGRFRRFLQRRSIAPEHIRLMVITHAHCDHIGNAKTIREICRCPVMVHEAEADVLRTGRVVVPPGCTTLGSVASAMGRAVAGLMSFEAFEPDIVITQETRLDRYGVNAAAVLTPGHTEGSLSVVLPGAACVGDLMMHVLAWGPGSLLPLFGDDVELIHESWERLAKLGVETYYPGHGYPFSVGLIRKALEARLRIAERGTEAEPTGAS